MFVSDHHTPMVGKTSMVKRSALQSIILQLLLVRSTIPGKPLNLSKALM
jgi:hypothetical protein